MKRSVPPLFALLVVAGCDGLGGAPASGVFCVVPVVMPRLMADGERTASALVEVDLGELATGPDPVLLTSVHLRPSSVGGALHRIEAAQVSVSRGAGPRSLLAAGGGAEDDGSVLLFPALETEVDLRALSSDGHLPLHLELAGQVPDGLSPLELQVCVTKVTPHGRL